VWKSYPSGPTDSCPRLTWLAHVCAEPHRTKRKPRGRRGEVRYGLTIARDERRAKRTPPAGRRRTFSVAARQPREGESQQNDVGRQRFFGLDAIEWSVTITGSVLLALTAWMM
jgi:hypothetical protein